MAWFIAGRYRSVAEIGAGSNLHAARLLFRSGVEIFCTDTSLPEGILTVPYFYDDIRAPNYALYQGKSCLYSIRPTEEMIEPLKKVAKRINADLYVYYLGFEGFSNPSPVPKTNISIHHLVSRRN